MSRIGKTPQVVSVSPTSGSRARASRSVRVTRIAVGIVAAAILIYAVSTPMLTLIGQQLVHVDPLERVDAMVVLASSTDRVVEAAELYRGGYAPLIVLTTDPPDPSDQFLRSRGIYVETSEQHRQRILQALGVPASAIVVLEDVVNSTADEALFLARWSRGRAIRSVMVVTSPTHSGRARLTFVHALRDLDIRVICRTSKLSRFRTDTWWHSRDTVRDVVIEWEKLMYYRAFELWRVRA